MSHSPDASAPARRVVALAASAGGVRALSAVLAGLPAGFPAALLVVQHLEAGRSSRLAEVLALRSLLPVAEARGGELPAAGRVYLAPPGRHLVVGADRRLALSDAPPVHHVRPSADPLFASAAAAFGPALVAVVLTGRGGDGSGALPAVRARGGTVVAQDPADALAPGMPSAALATGVVDHVVPLAGVAPCLARLVTGTAA